MKLLKTEGCLHYFQPEKYKNFYIHIMQDWLCGGYYYKISNGKSTFLMKPANPISEYVDTLKTAQTEIDNGIQLKFF